VDGVRNRPRPDIPEACIAQEILELGRVAKAVTTIRDGTNVALSNFAQLEQERKFSVAPPCTDAQAAVAFQDAVHLAHRSRSIRKELNPLLAGDDIELFFVAEWTEERRYECCSYSSGKLA
jgi:hypothetical protein